MRLSAVEGSLRLRARICSPSERNRLLACSIVVSGVEEERFFASVGWKTRTTLLLKNSEEEKRKDSVELNRARLVLQLLGRRGGAYRLGRRVGRPETG